MGMLSNPAFRKRMTEMVHDAGFVEGVAGMKSMLDSYMAAHPGVSAKDATLILLKDPKYQEYCTMVHNTPRPRLDG